MTEGQAGQARAIPAAGVQIRLDTYRRCPEDRTTLEKVSVKGSPGCLVFGAAIMKSYCSGWRLGGLSLGLSTLGTL